MYINVSHSSKKLEQAVKFMFYSSYLPVGIAGTSRLLLNSTKVSSLSAIFIRINRANRSAQSIATPVRYIIEKTMDLGISGHY